MHIIHLSSHTLSESNITAPSKNIQDDIYFERSKVTNFVHEHTPIFSMMLVLAVSYTSGVLAWVILSRKREELVKYIIVGASRYLLQ